MTEEPRRAATRRLLDTVVHTDPSIEFVVAFYRDGDTDTFSSEPEATECHRHRVIKRCKKLIRSIEKMVGQRDRCPTRKPAERCPADD